MPRLTAAGSAYPAPMLDVTQWFGSETSLAQLRGQVVMIEAFQMLCPGCISYGLPQAQRVHKLFPDVAVLGLHTVFEHHEVTGPAALKVFLDEFGIFFPVGVDRHDGQRMPVTMRAYELQGTPSTLLVDRAGNLRFTHLGAVPELELGAMLGELRAEPAPA
ncbi:redoxin domain-containing protein [Microbacterium kribbense]|uniref:Redoxin domain-containing protein n=1 Tax=Microbacterium kribbense TaxID=433645 RepID=A0ABP7GA56_9MICO